VPTPACLQSANSTEIAVPTDSPKHHLGVHTFVNLNQGLFDNTAAGVCLQKREGRSAFQSSLGLPEPSQSAFPTSVNGLGGRKNADDAKYTIGLFHRQLFATGTPVLECSRRDDYLVDLRPLKAKGGKAFDDRCPKPAFDEAQDIRFRSRCPKPEPIADLNIGSIHDESPYYIMPHICRQNVAP
jgi:hypothetical protein